jgi:hypothetical protein
MSGNSPAWKQNRYRRARMQRQATIADYIGQCDDALRTALERGNGAWPDHLIVPFRHPTTRHRAALFHWLDEIEAQSGKPIRLYYRNDIG